MAHKVDKSWFVICDLIECLVKNTDGYDSKTIDEKTNKPKAIELAEARLPRTQNEKRADEIISILFGATYFSAKVGNPSFIESDTLLMKKLKAEMHETGLSRDELLPKYIGRADRRNRETTTDESIRERLIKVFQNLKDDYEYGDDEGSGFEDIISSQLIILRPWLQKYKAELTTLLNL